MYEMYKELLLFLTVNPFFGSSTLFRSHSKFYEVMNKRTNVSFDDTSLGQFFRTERSLFMTQQSSTLIFLIRAPVIRDRYWFVCLSTGCDPQTGNCHTRLP